MNSKLTARCEYANFDSCRLPAILANDPIKRKIAKLERSYFIHGNTRTLGIAIPGGWHVPLRCVEDVACIPHSTDENDGYWVGCELRQVYFTWGISRSLEQYL